MIATAARGPLRPYSRNIAVALTTPLEPGDRLIAMLQVGTGKVGVYEFGAHSIAHDKAVKHRGRR